MSLLDQYIDEIEKDLQINEFNLKDSSMRTPARKHYWVSKLIRHKKNLLSLRQKRDLIKKEVTSFCYPYGRKNSYNKETIKILKKARYKNAISVESRDIKFDDISRNIYEIPRYDCNEIAKVFKFI